MTIQMLPYPKCINLVNQQFKVLKSYLLGLKTCSRYCNNNRSNITLSNCQHNKYTDNKINLKI